MITDFNLLRLYFDVRTLITLINYGGNKLKMIIFLRVVFVSLLDRGLYMYIHVCTAILGQKLAKYDIATIWWF